MMSAAVRSSFLVLRMRPCGAPSVSPGSPFTSGMTATPVSKPDRPERELGKEQSATTSIIHGLTCCAEQRVPPARKVLGC